METKFSTCVFCDGGCAVAATRVDGKLKVVPANPQAPAICSKIRIIDEYRLHPDRITHPLKRMGERGSGQWEEVSWDQALDEIAAKLQQVIATYGPETFAVSEMPLNIGFGGITRRLMNHLGAVNYIAPVQLCMGNTAQVHRAVYGWYTSANWQVADCIIYFGQDRDTERWPREFLNLKEALARGATLIEVDPRITETSKLAQHHLRIRYGTDAALALAWINVIIEEDLYDHGFVSDQCIGFDELSERVREYDPERVAQICGISAEQIRETARIYANAQAALIPWGVVPDMQVNSTSLIQALCILRAICGNLNKSETVFGPALGGVTNAQLADYPALTAEQRAKQLGRHTHSLLTFAASDLYRDALQRFGIPYEPDILTQSCAAIPPDLFAAMRGEGPYPVKAFFAVANNTVMSYANQQGIVDALMNQDLMVAFENWMTPTAQLSDYVLPGDMWAERDVLAPAFDLAPLLTVGQAFCEPVGECKSWYFVVKGLADRLGLADAFPWEDEYALYDFRLAPLDMTWEDACAQAPMPVMMKPVAMGRFVTPSGKVELASSVLADLGYDSLPSYIEPADPGAASGKFPYIAFAGYRERYSYNTCLHQIESLRVHEPDAYLFINPEDAQREDIAEGDACEVESAYGKVRLLAKIDANQPAGSIRVPHGWWKPETAQGLAEGLSGALQLNDGMLFPDESWNLDGPQGVPGLRGSIHVRVTKL